MLKLLQCALENNGKKIVYHYKVSPKIEKYFNKNSPLYIAYQQAVNPVPQSILVIPFLSNMLPISWFAGFDIEVDEVDEDFFNAIKQVKSEFQKQYASYPLAGQLIAKTLVKNKLSGTKSAMLFSGGVDAYATYIRTYQYTPDLITIHGADIEIQDHKQWHEFTEFIALEALLKNNTKNYIETNVRTFYTYQVELLLKDIGWWGKVQHGLSLIGSVAPLSFLNNYTQLYIASSYTKQIEIAWGSTPQIDEKISWAGIRVHHDGYELKRQDKVDLITAFSKKTNTQFKLRVCYSELRSEFNCSHCEKCYRTILGIILNGENPNHYGFQVDKTVYKSMFEVLNIGSASRGMQYFWQELMEKAKNTENVYVFEDSDLELDELDKIKSGELNRILENKIVSSKKFNSGKLKFFIINKFSGVYRLYKKIRYS